MNFNKKETKRGGGGIGNVKINKTNLTKNARECALLFVVVCLWREVKDGGRKVRKRNPDEKVDDMPCYTSVTFT